MTAITEQFVDFIVERERIRVRKEAGEAPPWTDSTGVNDDVAAASLPSKRKRAPRVRKIITNLGGIARGQAPMLLGGHPPPLANLSNSKRTNMSQRRVFGLRSMRARPVAETAA